MEASRRQSRTLSKAHVITVSDGVFHGNREDKSGPALVALLQGGGFEVGGPEVVPDETGRITEAIETAITLGADIVVTTGGTGLGPRDVTPQATAALIEYDVPGIAEEMRRAGVASTPMAALSRAMAGVRGRTLIINVPGSVRGATESLEAVMPIVGHAVQLLHGDTAHS
jgi:molybdenum cofactor synthesis domain-containing protein